MLSVLLRTYTKYFTLFLEQHIVPQGNAAKAARLLPLPITIALQDRIGLEKRQEWLHLFPNPTPLRAPPPPNTHTQTHVILR